jgi:hypothetical protein
MTRNEKTQKKSQKSKAKSRKLAKTKTKSKRAKTEATASKTKSKIESTTKHEKRRHSRFIGCTATINATVQRIRPPEKRADGAVVDDGCVIQRKSKGGHNHPTTRELFKYYPEIRLPKTVEMFSDVERMLSCGGNATGICLTYRRETGAYQTGRWALIMLLTISLLSVIHRSTKQSEIFRMSSPRSDARKWPARR